MKTIIVYDLKSSSFVTSEISENELKRIEKEIKDFDLDDHFYIERALVGDDYPVFSIRKFDVLKSKIIAIEFDSHESAGKFHDFIFNTDFSKHDIEFHVSRYDLSFEIEYYNDYNLFKLGVFWKKYLIKKEISK